MAGPVEADDMLSGIHHERLVGIGSRSRVIAVGVTDAIIVADVESLAAIVADSRAYSPAIATVGEFPTGVVAILETGAVGKNCRHTGCAETYH